MLDFAFPEEEKAQYCADENHHILLKNLVIMKVEEVMVDEPNNPDDSAEPREPEEPVAPWHLSEPELGARVLPQITIINGTSIGISKQVELHCLLASLPCTFFAVSDTRDGFHD